MLMVLIIVNNNDNSLSNIATTVDSLIQKLEWKCKLVIKWFHENNMIVNHDKFQANVLGKHKSNNIDVNPLMSGGNNRSNILKQICS